MRRFVRTVLVTGTLAAGSIVVGAPPAAAATTVSTEAQLRTAFANAAETEITLANNIDLVDCGAGDVFRNAGGPLTIIGNGYTIRQTCAAKRVLFNGNPAGPLTLNGVTITGGSTPAAQAAGGVLSANSVTIINTTITGNSGAFAAGIRVANTGEDITVTNSTITGNTVNDPALGGAGLVAADVATITNSTITGNTSAGYGGGVVANNGILLRYSTVVGNTAASGGANVHSFGGAVLTSIASVAASPQGGVPNCAGLSSTTSHGFNFSDDTTCGFITPSDNQAVGNNPQLGALASNGGPTQTRMPQPGSPLINPIPGANCQDFEAAGITSDQRGVFRPQGPGCDIGAVERRVCPPATQASVGVGTLAGAEGVVAVAPVGLYALFRRRRRGAPSPVPRRDRVRSVVTWLMVAGVAVAVLAACQPVKKAPPC